MSIRKLRGTPLESWLDLLQMLLDHRLVEFPVVSGQRLRVRRHGLVGVNQERLGLHQLP